MADLMKATDDVVPGHILRSDVFGLSTDDPNPGGFDEGVIPTCAGEWRKRPDLKWQFFEHVEPGER